MEVSSNPKFLPFLRWPGGKRWLPSLVHDIVGNIRIKRYFEPFLGGGAFFFHFAFCGANLSDLNGELINTYRQIRDDPLSLIGMIKNLKVDEATYESLRRAKGGSGLERATRFLYLNRTAFGGVYRLNRSGDFNVPFGGGQRTPGPLWTRGLILNAAKALAGAKLTVCDFEEALQDSEPGDLVYCDPTYTVCHNNNGFVRYNEKNFSWADQKRLAAACSRIADRGVTVIVSNAFHQGIRELYGDFNVRVVERRNAICPKPHARGKATEYVFFRLP
jgi:DNA adenine methylase